MDVGRGVALAVTGPTCGELLAGSGSFQPLGVLHFQLAPNAVFPPSGWLPELELRNNFV